MGNIMILKLTNTSVPRKGQTILINTDHIISMYPDEVEGDTVTVLYGSAGGSWLVAETVEHIYDKLDK